MHPQFVCIGFQKCGTTTLYDILKQHSKVALTRDVKEPMFYRVRGLRLLFGAKWYERRYFPDNLSYDGKVLGEINAGLTFGNAPDKIGKDFPKDTKLIFMMRNPADRAYSAYRFFNAMGFLSGDVMKYDAKYGHAQGFDRYVRSVLNNPKKRRRILKDQMKYIVFSQGFYDYHVERYLKYFPKEQMKFIVFEEFVNDEEGICKEIYDFIGVPVDPNVRYGISSNEGNIHPRSPFWGKYGMFDMGAHYVEYEFFEWARFIPHIYKYVVRPLHEATQAFCVIPDGSKEKMLPETRELLRKFYAKSVINMSKIAGRNLGEVWR